VITGSHADIPAPNGYERIDRDLNEGAGGSYIYACVKRDGTSALIVDLAVVAGDSASIAPPSPRYQKINVDLNQGAGGKYIYLCYSRS
jgi:hypothetical protein